MSNRFVRAARLAVVGLVVALSGCSTSGRALGPGATPGQGGTAGQLTGPQLAQIIGHAPAVNSFTVTGLGDNPDSGPTLLPPSGHPDAIATYTCGDNTFSGSVNQENETFVLADELNPVVFPLGGTNDTAFAIGDQVGTNQAVPAGTDGRYPTAILAQAIYQLPDAATATAYVKGLRAFLTSCSSPQLAGQTETIAVADAPAVDGHPAFTVHIQVVDYHTPSFIDSVSNSLFVVDGAELVAVGLGCTSVSQLAQSGAASAAEITTPPLPSIAEPLVAGLAAKGA